MAGTPQTHIEQVKETNSLISWSEWSVWTGTILVLGVILRVTQYLINRSLWYDEALLALNILHHPFSETFQPLQYHQGAPIGFLLIEKLAVVFAGKSEMGLRIIPLVAGISALFLFWYVARLYVSAKAVPVALLLFALCPALVYYSSEVKQYSSDVAVTLVLLWMAFRLADSPLTLKSLFGYSMVGATVVWLSHPASFVLAGIGAVLTIAALSQREWRRLGQLTPVFAAWGASFAVCYLLSLRLLARDQSLLNYWHGAFPPHPLWSIKSIYFFIDNFFAAFAEPAGLIPVLGAVLFIVGCAQLVRKRILVFSLLTVPITITLLAACVGKYPLEGRLLLFLTPILLMAVAEGAIRCYDFSRRFSPVLGMALIALLLAQPVWTASANLIRPPRLGDLKPAIHYVLSRQQQGDNWYIFYGSKCQFAYYAELYQLPTRNVRFGTDCGDDAACYAQDLSAITNGGRTWVLLSHILLGNGMNEENILVDQLNTIGTRLDAYRTRGGRAYLYNLKNPQQLDSQLARDLNQSRAPSWDDECISTINSR